MKPFHILLLTICLAVGACRKTPDERIKDKRVEIAKVGVAQAVGSVSQSEADARVKALEAEIDDIKNERANLEISARSDASAPPSDSELWLQGKPWFDRNMKGVMRLNSITKENGKASGNLYLVEAHIVAEPLQDFNYQLWKGYEFDFIVDPKSPIRAKKGVTLGARVTLPFERTEKGWRLVAEMLKYNNPIR